MRGRFLPRTVVAWIAPEAAGAERYVQAVPFLRDRRLTDGRATAYVCENFTCRQPVTAVEDLVRLLAG